MNKKRGVIFLNLILFLIIISCFIVAARSVSLTVYTIPNHNLIIRILDIKSNESLDTVYATANEKGEAITSFETSYEEIALFIFDRYNGETVKTMQTEVYNTDLPIVIELVPRPIIKNDSANASSSNSSESVMKTLINDNNKIEKNYSEMIANSSERNSSFQKITGFATSLFDENTKKYGYVIVWILVTLAVLSCIVYLIKKYKLLSRIKRKNIERNETIKKIKDAEDEYEDDETIKKIKDAEERIRQAEMEIKEIKKKEIIKTEKRLSVLKGIKKEDK